MITKGFLNTKDDATAPRTSGNIHVDVDGLDARMKRLKGLHSGGSDGISLRKATWVLNTYNSGANVVNEGDGANVVNEGDGWGMNTDVTMHHNALPTLSKATTHHNQVEPIPLGNDANSYIGNEGNVGISGVDINTLYKADTDESNPKVGVDYDSNGTIGVKVDSLVGEVSHGDDKGNKDNVNVDLEQPSVTLDSDLAFDASKKCHVEQLITNANKNFDVALNKIQHDIAANTPPSNATAMV